NLSTTKEIPMGASQPPSRTASAPPLIQTSTSNQISSPIVTARVLKVTTIWLTGRRTRVKAIAAPRLGSKTDSGASVTTEKSFIDGHLHSGQPVDPSDRFHWCIRNKYSDPRGLPGILNLLTQFLRHLQHHKRAVLQPECLQYPLGPHHVVPKPRIGK